MPELCQRYKKPRQTPYTQAEPIEKRHLILLPKHATSRISVRSGSTHCRRKRRGSRNRRTALVAGDRRIAGRRAGARSGQAHRAKAGEPRLMAKRSRKRGRPLRHPHRRRAKLYGGAVCQPGGRYSPLARLRQSAPARIVADALRPPTAVAAVAASVSLRFCERRRNGPAEAGAARRGRRLQRRPRIGQQSRYDRDSPSGTFTMGSPGDEAERQPNEGPQHHVALTSFFIGRGADHPGAVASGGDGAPTRLAARSQPRAFVLSRRRSAGREHLLVEADEYCRRLAGSPGATTGCRARPQWEYACRAGSIGAVPCRTDDHHRSGELLRRRRGRLRRQRRQEHRLRLLRRCEI